MMDLDKSNDTSETGHMGNKMGNSNADPASNSTLHEGGQKDGPIEWSAYSTITFVTDTKCGWSVPGNPWYAAQTVEFTFEVRYMI
jgi:hypothetical protein